MMQQPHSTGLQLSWHIRAIYFFLKYIDTHFHSMPSSSYTIVARPISIADIYVCQFYVMQNQIIQKLAYLNTQIGNTCL